MEIWTINVYYNPKRFLSRYRNFMTFRESLNAPMLTVEWSQNGNFELSSRDSDILIRLSGGDLMWQKERLLNIAIQALPASCDVVAWLDNDIIFENDHWVENLKDSLTDTPIVQLFSEVNHLESEGSNSLFVRESLVAMWMKYGSARLGERMRSLRSHTKKEKLGNAADEMMERLRLGTRPSSGHAWAAQRSLIEAHGLYDGCICGTGDMSIGLAALGLQDLFPQLFPLNAAQKSHYKTWADPFAESTEGRVGVLSSRIQHLFHGLLSNRRYRTRLQWASESGLDPGRDLSLDEQGLWRWTSNRQLREAWMNEYFERRLEDEQSFDGGLASS